MGISLTVVELAVAKRRERLTLIRDAEKRREDFRLTTSKDRADYLDWRSKNRRFA